MVDHQQLKMKMIKSSSSLSFCLLLLLSLLLSTINVVNSQTITPLTAGKVVNNSISTLEFVYYSIAIPSQTTKDLSISVTPLDSGDPDLYVSLGMASTPIYPSYSDRMYSAVTLGEDTITIVHTDFQQYDMVYIGVNAYRPSVFTIVASYDDEITLSDAVPQGGMVHTNGIDYYKFIVDDNNADSIVITVQEMQGQLDPLYVSTHNTLPNPASSSSYDFFVRRSYTGERLVINRNDPKWPANNVFTIAVVGHTTCYYSITAAKSSSSTILRDGIPVLSSITALTYQYYTYNLNDENCDVNMQLTSISGDPDLFVSRSNQHPTSDSTTYDYASRRFGNDSIIVPYSNRGPLFIGVLGWRNSTYSILAQALCSNRNDSFIFLFDGIPSSGTLESTQKLYYQFPVSTAGKEITITLSRTYGDPDMFVVAVPTMDDLHQLPSFQNYQWLSTFEGDDMITIRPDDPNYCPNSSQSSCIYVIGVIAFSATSFTIQASTNTASILLRDGISVFENLDAGDVEYFVFPMDNYGYTLTVSVTDLGTGDPDLFISTSNMHPNTTKNSMWSSQRLRGDSITIPPTDPHYCSQCTYYIGVYAFASTSFTIVASTLGNLTLQDGIPQYGEALRGVTDYYSFIVTDTHSSVSITLTALSGLNSLYAGNQVYPEINDASTYQFYVPYYSGFKQLVIPADDSNACKLDHDRICRYYIAVYAIGDTSYSLTASTSAATKPLQNGVPLQGVASENEYVYFSFDVSVPNQDLTFILTALSGDPDVYVGMGNNYRPTSGNSQFNSTGYGSDSIDINDATMGTYYIGVTSFGYNTTFTITAVLTDGNGDDHRNIVSLIAGQPQASGPIHAGRWQYYSFLYFENAQELDISVTKLFGDPDLYVKVSDYPTLTNYDYSATSSGDDFINIENPANGRYFIGVYAFDTTSVVITATTSTGINTLQSGVPSEGNLGMTESQYYRLYVDRCDVDVTFTVTPFNGDPDLYIDNELVHPDNHFPNSTIGHYTWKANSYLGDSVTISATDEYACCRCYYYINVNAFSPSRYIITGSFHFDTLLQDSTPQEGAVDKHAWLYYHFIPREGINSVTFTLTPSNGNSALYVDRGQQQPTLDHYDRRAVSYFSSVSIVYRSTDDDWCNPDIAHQCVYRVGVYGNSESNFTVIASTSADAIALQDGRPQRSQSLDGQYQYFYYINNQPGTSVTFALTALTGDPDMYISTRTTRPNATSFEYRSTMAGSDAVVIDDSKATTYYVGVYGFFNSTFYVAVYVTDPNGEPTQIVLVNGVPQTGVVTQRHWQYYRFTLSDQTADLVISANRQFGDPDLYVTTDGTLPTLVNYEYSSNSMGKDMITIFNPIQTTYIIGVYGFFNSMYTISAVTADAKLALSDGVAYREDLIANQYDYFILPVDNTDKDLTVTVTSLNGDPDLFISDINPTPSFANHTWAAYSYREDSITIPSSELTAGVYYISVFAFSNCSFTIVASFKDTVSLQDGVPQAGQVEKESMAYYTLTVPSGVNSITIDTTRYNGTSYLYVSTTTKPTHDDPTSYQWSSTNDYSNNRLVLAPSGKSNDPFKVPATYYIGVYGRTFAQYQIVASTAIIATTLSEGVATYGQLSAGATRYYVFENSLHQAAVSFVATLITGNVQVYVSTIEQHPSANNHQWILTDPNLDGIYVAYADIGYVPTDNQQNGEYYIAVTASSDASFNVIASVYDLSSTGNNDHLIVLTDGQPQSDVLIQENSVRYYSFVAQPSATNVVITVTPFYGDPDLYVNIGTVNPTKQKSDYSSTSIGGDSLNIPNQCQNDLGCEYRIAVVASSRTFYSIVATVNTIELQSGVSILGSVEFGQYQYYRIDLRLPSPSLIIEVTPLSGDPDLFASYHVRYPNRSSIGYDYHSMNGNTLPDVIQIDQPTHSTYYISVYGWKNSTYTITATLGSILLIPGRPHADILRYGQHRLYAFKFNDPDKKQPLSISLALSNSGQAAVYVTNNGTIPTPENFLISTLGAVDLPNLLVISPNDAEYCSNCTWLISVYPSYRLVYSITATQGQLPQQLISGHRASGVIEANEYRYYEATTDQYRDIYIVATEYLGDVTIVVGTDPDTLPTLDKYIWKAGDIPNVRGINLVIPHDDPKFITGRYFIGVYGQVAARYDITFTTSAILLTPGIPQIGVATPIGTNYFFSIGIDDRADLTFSIDRVSSLSSASSSDISLSSSSSLHRQMQLMKVNGVTTMFTLYISTNETDPGPLTSYMWSASLAYGGSFSILDNDQNNCAPDESCYFYINLVGSADNKPYSLRLTTAESVVVLFPDTQTSSTVDVNKYKYFQTVVNEADNFTIALEPCTGSADLYVSWTYQLPTSRDYERSASNDDSIDVIHFPSYINNNIYSIAVYGKSTTNNAPISFQLRTQTAGDQLARPIIDDSKILTSTPTKGVIRIQFKPAHPTSSSKTLSYQIFYSKDSQPGLVMYTRCGLENAISYKIVQVETSSNEYVSVDIEDLEGNEYYSINVLAYDTTPTAYSLYKPQSGIQVLNDEVDGDSSRKLRYIFGIGVPAAILVFGFVAYLVYRNRQLTKELSIEMHDVPKSAVRKAVRGPPTDVNSSYRPNKAGQKYSTLLSEDEEGDEDDIYSPPRDAANI